MRVDNIVVKSNGVLLLEDLRSGEGATPGFPGKAWVDTLPATCVAIVAVRERGNPQRLNSITDRFMDGLHVYVLNAAHAAFRGWLIVGNGKASDTDVESPVRDVDQETLIWTRIPSDISEIPGQDLVFGNRIGTVA